MPPKGLGSPSVADRGYLGVISSRTQGKPQKSGTMWPACAVVAYPVTCIGKPPAAAAEKALMSSEVADCGTGTGFGRW